MADLEDNFACCGLREINWLSEHRTPESALFSLSGFALQKDRKWRHAIFTQAGRGRYGDRLKAYILQHQLGSVVESPGEVNPNSGRVLKAFIWTINWTAVDAWMKAHNVPTADVDSVVW